MSAMKDTVKPTTECHSRLHNVQNSPKIVLVIRKSKEWFHGIPDKILFTEDVPTLRAKHLIQGWNMFFDFTYSQFRKEMEDIAECGYFQNNFDSIFKWIDWDILQHYDSDTWIVPIDNDDWMSPHLVTTIRQYLSVIPEKMGIIRWNMAYINQFSHCRIKRGQWCSSCEYAIRMPCLKENINGHDSMTKMFHVSETYHIPETLTVNVHNIGSLSWFQNVGCSIPLLIDRAKHPTKIENNKILIGFEESIRKYNNILIKLKDSCKV